MGIFVLKTFKADTRGNVATMFAVTISMLLLLGGAAVDYSGLSSKEQSLQDAVDAATLAAAKANTADESQLKIIVKKFLNEKNFTDQNVNFDVKVVDDEVIVTANTDYDTALMGFVGQDKLKVSVISGSPIAALTPVQVALVLDTTTSMEGADMMALKSAANAMIDEFETFESTVAVSVVPFGQYVNVGTSNKMASWLDVAKDGTTETNEVCWDERTTKKAGECKKTGKKKYYDDIRDGRNFGKKSYDEETCTPAEYEYTGNRICEDQTTTHVWNGCVGSRQSPYNEQAAFGSTRITGVMDESCGTTLRPLTKQMTQVRTTLAAMTANGSTYLPSGVVWGWRTLQDAEPMKPKVVMKNSEGKKTSKPAKVMIVMTDGANTLSQGGDEPHLHNWTDTTAANTRTANLCAAAKADGIQIFTVGYRMDVADAATQTLLRDCATTPSNFANAANAAQLKKTFKDIAGKLDFTRLTM